MLDAHQLNVFLVAAEMLNFSRAAQRLHMTQPSVTQHIQALELRFDTPLFLRAGHRLTLTEAGSTLVPLARQMIEISIRTEETMQSIKGDLHGHLLVGCSTTTGKYVLPLLMAGFMHQNPHVIASCRSGDRGSALQMLRNGEAHLALSSAFDVSNEFEFRKFFSEPVVLITSLDHPWAQSGEIDIDQLSEGTFILREETAGTYMVARDALAKQGLRIETLNCILTLGNSEAIAFAVQEGLGVGFISQIVARNIMQDKLAQIKVRGLDMNQNIYIVQNWRLPATTVQTAFWNYVNDPENPIIQQMNSLMEQSVEMAI